jgi:hypothetical protein
VSVCESLHEGYMGTREENVPCCCLYTHLGDVEEIFNPLGVSLGAS